MKEYIQSEGEIRECSRSEEEMKEYIQSEGKMR